MKSQGGRPPAYCQLHSFLKKDGHVNLPVWKNWIVSSLPQHLLITCRSLPCSKDAHRLKEGKGRREATPTSTIGLTQAAESATGYFASYVLQCTAMRVSQNSDCRCGALCAQLESKLGKAGLEVAHMKLCTMPTWTWLPPAWRKSL